MVVIADAKPKDERGVSISIGISTIARGIAVVVVIVIITGPTMAMPNSMAVIPAFPGSAVPAVHFLHKPIVQFRDSGLTAGKTATKRACNSRTGQRQAAKCDCGDNAG